MTTWAILASGPSMSQEVANAVKGLKVIAVSNTFELAPWADVLVSNDKTWWTNNPKSMEFEGEKICGLTIEPPKGVTRFANAMSGGNSGLLALQVAISKGAERILLFGFDMGGSHYFGAHPSPLRNPDAKRFETFKKQFAGFKAPSGVEIINCTPDSALKCYPFGDAKDYLPQPEPEAVDLTGPRGQKGDKGDRGEKGIGERGPRGAKGDDGPMGPMPDHQWDGTRLRFEEPDGGWGKYVDLKGPKGSQGASAGGGGGKGMTTEQQLQLQTLLNIFGGWISTPPIVSIDSLVADELQVTADGSASGFYTTVPGAQLLDAAYEWNWGDGATSNTVDAIHSYAAAGTYLITFRARNHIGWSEPVSQELEVSDGGGPVVTDPNVTINLTFSGADGAISFNDVLGNAFTAQGQAELSTDAPLYAPASGLIPNADSYFQSVDTGGAVLGTEDFAVECWFETNENEVTLIDAQGDEPGGWVLVGDSDGSRIFFYSEGDQAAEAYLGPLGLNFKGAGIKYVCAQRRSGVMQWFFNTAYLFYSDLAFTRNLNVVASLLTVGRRQEDAASRPFIGKFGGVRITVGGYRHEAENLEAVPSPYDLIA